MLLLLLLLLLLRLLLLLPWARWVPRWRFELCVRLCSGLSLHGLNMMGLKVAPDHI